MRLYPFDDFLAWVLVFEGIRAVCWVLWAGGLMSMLRVLLGVTCPENTN